MPEFIDCEWFAEQTSDAQTLALVRQIALWQEAVLQTNQMPVDLRVFTLELGGDHITLEAGSAVNALEIYQEIFRDGDHQKVDGFSPANKKCIIDLGANYGFYALQVMRESPECRLLCVEPNPYIFPHLQGNLTRYANATCVNAAIGTENHIGRFELVRQLPSIGGLTLRQVDRKWMQDNWIETVAAEYITLPEVYTRFAFPECDILKVDVEGMEGELFDATADEVLRRAQRIVVERHTAAIHGRVINRLTAAGFALVFDPDPECLRHYNNLYFCRV